MLYCGGVSSPTAGHPQCATPCAIALGGCTHPAGFCHRNGTEPRTSRFTLLNSWCSPGEMCVTRMTLSLTKFPPWIFVRQVPDGYILPLFRFPRALFSYGGGVSFSWLGKPGGGADSVNTVGNAYGFIREHARIGVEAQCQAGIVCQRGFPALIGESVHVAHGCVGEGDR